MRTFFHQSKRQPNQQSVFFKCFFVNYSFAYSTHYQKNIYVTFIKYLFFIKYSFEIIFKIYFLNVFVTFI